MERMAAHAGRSVPEGKLTFEEFLAWCDEDTWAEWVKGEVVLLSPASRWHARLASFLDRVLGLYVVRRDLGEVLLAPFVMRIAPELSAREPDLLFVAREHLDRLRPTYLDGPADLAIEIVSPESLLRDRGEKFAEYELGGVREYWLLDPGRARADFYRLDAEGRYQRIPMEVEGVYRSEVVPGFWIRVSWLWQDPLPDPFEVLRELGVMP
jgi:Uma2 family endonuclease